MKPDAMLALYDWKCGPCFRCGQQNEFVTHLDEIITPSGDAYALAACGACILNLESERRRYAARRGLEYQPGSLGS